MKICESSEEIVEAPLPDIGRHRIGANEFCKCKGHKWKDHGESPFVISKSFTELDYVPLRQLLKDLHFSARIVWFDIVGFRNHFQRDILGFVDLRS